MDTTAKRPIKDTPKEDKSPNKGQAESTHSLYRKSPLKEDNLFTKDKMAGPESVLIKRFHSFFLCSSELKWAFVILMCRVFTPELKIRTPCFLKHFL